MTLVIDHSGKVHGTKPVTMKDLIANREVGGSKMSFFFEEKTDNIIFLGHCGTLN